MQSREAWQAELAFTNHEFRNVALDGAVRNGLVERTAKRKSKGSPVTALALRPTKKLLDLFGPENQFPMTDPSIDGNFPVTDPSPAHPGDGSPDKIEGIEEEGYEDKDQADGLAEPGTVSEEKISGREHGVDS